MNKLRTFLVALVMGVTATAQAGGILDLGQIELGHTYSIPETYNYGTIMGTVTPTTSGALTITGLNGGVVLYGDADHTTEISGTWNGTFGPNYAREYEVVGGTTYYAFGDFVSVYESIDFLRFEMTGDIEVEIDYVLPAAGASVTPITNDTGEVVLSFNAAVTYDFASLTVGSTAMDLGGSPVTPSAMQYVQIGETIRYWQNSGVLSEDGGETVSLCIAGLKTSAGKPYNGNGQLVINYVAAPRLAEMVNASISTDLKSFYPTGDAQALATFTFDKPLMNDGGTIFTLGIGNVEAENAYYLEHVTPVIEGNTVKVDFSGKLRELNTYAGAQGSNIVEARLMNVRDLNGNKAIGAGNGLVGSYVWNLNYVYIEPADIVSEFVPATGASLAGVNSIEIWFNHADLLTFDGVKFTCPEATAVVPLSQLTISDDAGGKVINVNIPDAIKGKSAVTVTLNNLLSLDGYDHSKQIKAEYDQFVATLVAPIQPGQIIASTGQSDFVITANGTYQYLRYNFYNKAPTAEDAGWAYGTEFVKQDNGTWTAYNPDILCYIGYDPRMVILAWQTEEDYNMGRPAEAEYEFTFVGLTRPFEYSSVKFESIDPEANSKLTGPFDNFYFTVKFDGMVTIDSQRTQISLGFGTSQPFDKIEAVDEEYGYANTWRLYPGNTFMNSNPGIDFAVVAFDQDGMMVEGNMGGDEYDYLSFSYLIANNENYRELTVTPESGSTVEEVSYYIVSYEGQPVSRNWNYTGQMPTIYDRFQTELYVFTDENINDIDGEGENSRMLLTVDPAFTAEGAYVLFIPEDFFVVGSQFDFQPNAEYWGTLFIEGPGVPGEGVTLVVTPAAGEVSALTRIDITSVEEDIEMAGTVNMGCEEDITITDAEGNVVFRETAAEMDAKSFDWDNWVYYGYFLEPNITADGVYTLDIPAGFIQFYYGESYSAPLVAVYTIGLNGVSSIVVDKADRYEVYTVAGVHVLSTPNAADLSTLRPGLYLINGRKHLIK